MGTPKAQRQVSVSRVIAAPAQTIFDVLADHTKHSIIDGSGTLVGAKSNPPWRHIGQHIWRYQLEPVEGGTKVTETFDWRPSPVPWLLEANKIPKKHPASMTKTLERLDAYVTTGEVPES